MHTILKNAISKLASRYQIFHSEADFKFKLAFEILSNILIKDIFLEYPLPNTLSKKRSSAIDMMISTHEGTEFPIEIKYIKGELKVNGYDLRSKPADECHLIFRDIERLEKIKKVNPKCKKAYVIVLGNNASYWNAPSARVTNAKEMYLKEGRTILPKKYQYITGVNNSKLDYQISGTYPVKWQNYSNFPNIKNGEFRYLILEIK